MISIILDSVQTVRCRAICLTPVADIKIPSIDSPRLASKPSKVFLSSAVVCLALAGCDFSPEAYESEPVTVQTRMGVVTCQLYTRDLVVWDRAIDRPDNMTVSTADAICVNEGQRRAEPNLFTGPVDES